MGVLYLNSKRHVKAEILVLCDVLRNAVRWLHITEDSAEGNSSPWLQGDNGLPASSTDGFCGMQKNQVNVGWSRRCWENEVCFMYGCSS